MLPLVAALTLSLWAEPVPPAPFDSILSKQMQLVEGSGGGVGPGGGQYAGAYALGVLGSGAALMLSLPLLSFSETNDVIAYAALIVPALAAAALHVGIGAWLGVPVSWGSALVGSLLGYATGLGLGFAVLSGAGTGEGFGDLGLFFLGIVAGFTLGTPLWTLIDPFGLASWGGSGGDFPVARPLSSAARERSDGIAPLGWAFAF